MWCFIHDGKKYQFPSESEARSKAFQLTGRIGLLPIYRYIPSEAAENRRRADLETLVALLGAAIGFALIGVFVWSGLAEWCTKLFGPFGTFIFMLAAAWFILVCVEFGMQFHHDCKKGRR
jgi:hypothetical protein